MTESIHDTTEDITEEEVVVDITSNDKPKVHEQPTVQPTVPQSKVVPAKRIDELTDDDKKILIDNARSGIDNPYYTVKLFKNGNTRICKKKKPTVAQNAVSTNGERLVKNQSGEQKVYMTDNQLMWEHLLELESKYSNLYRKHKKLKAKYNDLYIEDAPSEINLQPEPKIDNDTVIESNATPENEQTTMKQSTEAIYENPQPVQHYLPLGPQTNWRSLLRARLG